MSSVERTAGGHPYRCLQAQPVDLPLLVSHPQHMVAAWRQCSKQWLCGSGQVRFHQSPVTVVADHGGESRFLGLSVVRGAISKALWRQEFHRPAFGYSCPVVVHRGACSGELSERRRGQ